MMSPLSIALALGSNLGPGRETLTLACRELSRRGVRVVHRSRLFHTRPWGELDQPPFLNAAVQVHTRYTPLQLLEICLAIELALGRRRERRWGPRRLDIDVLFYGAVHLKSPSLTLPHPWIARRDFVLAPLLDLHLPPPPGSGLPPWSLALARLAPAERSIICAEPW
jgi:2-amino-4-hydroxy-6-hydroxymethyldihydropteridine diphosphokinase